MKLTLTALAALSAQTWAAVPSLPLYNAAVPGLRMPAVGLGTGGYSNEAKGYGMYPECWDDAVCPGYINQAVTTWLNVGGRRIDNANSYQDQGTVGAAVAASGVPRSEIFFLSKTGPSFPLGFADTLAEVATILNTTGLGYVDALLIHWPCPDNKCEAWTNTSTDPLCNVNSQTFSPTACRISTWKAYVQVFNSGKALSIGVSNFNATHLQEIIDAGLPLPAINQIPFHLYRSSSQQQTIDFCRAHNITVNGYSPLGIPDWKTFPTSTGMSTTQRADPVVQGIAAAHGVSPSKVLLAWQWALGIPVNPRSQNVDHMIENLNYFDLQLTQAEIGALSSRPQSTCSVDPTFYECAP
jgi:2,5-diketo-D-gluconate reductase A